jgi:ribosome modulation factor
VARDELRPFEAGLFAALAGAPKTANRYRKANRRNAWLRGWLAGREAAEIRAAQAAMNQEERSALAGKWQGFRALLD